MQINRKEIFEKVKDFIIKRHIMLVLILAPIGGIVVFSGMVLYNQSATFCQKCHKNQGTYFSIDMRIPAHKDINKGGPTCVSCHPDKAVEMLLMRSLKKVPKYSQRVANLRVKESVNSKNIYQDEECISCHLEILNLAEVDEPNLPLQVKDIGLRYDHEIHYRFVYFRAEDEQRWKQLRIKDNLNKKEQEEFTLLEKIRMGNCETCHIQSKKDEIGENFVDKTVNYTARNPISCAGCHEDALPTTHPGNDMRFPSKETCQKCHHGKIHGKFLIFKADCEDTSNTENCMKCHPQYKQEKNIEIVDN